MVASLGKKRTSFPSLEIHVPGRALDLTRRQKPRLAMSEKSLHPVISVYTLKAGLGGSVSGLECEG